MNFEIYKKKSARFLTSTLLEHWEEAANFVGARPKLKLTTVLSTARNALQHTLTLVQLDCLFRKFSCNMYVNSDHIWRVMSCDWLVSCHFNYGQAHILCESALNNPLWYNDTKLFMKSVVFVWSHSTTIAFFLPFLRPVKRHFGLRDTTMAGTYRQTCDLWRHIT